MSRVPGERLSRGDLVVAAIAIALGAVLVFIFFFRNDSSSKNLSTDNAVAETTTTPKPGTPFVVRMLQPGTYFSLGAHKLCYPETEETHTQGHIKCSWYNLENSNIVAVLGGPTLGSDNAWYWPIQVLQGSLWAEFGDGNTRAIWWLKDALVLLDPIANVSPVPPESEIDTEVTYVMDWRYFVRNGPAGPVIITNDEGHLVIDSGSTHVTFTGKKEVGTSETTGTRWWCQVATIGDRLIEEVLGNLSDAERELGAWVPCEFQPAQH